MSRRGKYTHTKHKGPKIRSNDKVSRTTTSPSLKVIAKTRKSLAKQLGLNGSEIQAEMMQGDYEHLLEVFDKNFGDYVILER